MANIILFLFLLYPGYDFLTVTPVSGPISAASCGIYSLWFNPGAMGDRTSIVFSENFWFTDSKISNIGFIARRWGVKATYLDFGEIEFQDETPDDEGGIIFNPYAFLFGIYRNFRIDDETSVGFGVQYFYYKIYESSMQNALLDVGLYYDPLLIPPLKLGFSITNFGLKAGFNSITYKMPTRAIFSVRYLFHRIELDYTYDRIITYSKDWFVVEGEGIEHRLTVYYESPYFFNIRASYSKGREIDPLSFGLDINKGRLTLSYDIRPAHFGFDPVHIVSLIIELQ